MSEIASDLPLNGPDGVYERYWRALAHRLGALAAAGVLNPVTSDHVWTVRVYPGNLDFGVNLSAIGRPTKIQLVADGPSADANFDALAAVQERMEFRHARLLTLTRLNQVRQRLHEDVGVFNPLDTVDWDRQHRLLAERLEFWGAVIARAAGQLQGV